MPKNKPGSSGGPSKKYGIAIQSCPLVQNSIYVQVVYWNNSKPVTGVKIQLVQTGASGFTNEKGVKQFKGLLNGAYDVQIDIGALAGQYSIDKSEEQQDLEGDQEAYCIFFLYKRSSMRVLVTGPEGKLDLTGGIGFAVASSADRYGSATGQASADAHFPDVKAGQYGVSLTLPPALDRFYVPRAVADTKVTVPEGGHVDFPVALLVRPVPTLQVADPKVILVKRDYHDGVLHKPHRLAIHPGKTGDFDGTAILSSNLANSLTLYRAAEGGVGTPLPAPITNQELTSGAALYLEATQPTALGGPSQLELALTGGTIPFGPAVKAQVTCVRLTLDLHGYKPQPGGPDAPVLSDQEKFDAGHTLHLQGTSKLAGRALLAVRRAEPADYKGKQILTPIGARLSRLKDEVPSSSGLEARNRGKSTFDCQLADEGVRYWIEGEGVSQVLCDCGYTLSLQALPGLEGDRIHVTVVKVTVDICEPRIPPAIDPVPIAASKKLGPGRFLHLQGGAHGRAKVIVSAVEPAAFAGNLELVVWDRTANSDANPRVSFYDAEVIGGGALGQPCVVPAGVAPEVRWAEGVTMSPNPLDTEIRLRVAGAEGWADCARLTVGKFFVTRITFRNTAANIHYARIPDPIDAPSYLYAAPADRNVAHKHITPAAVRPAAGTPHWVKEAGDTFDADLSWPAAYTRAGAAGAPPAPQLRASFETVPRVPGDIAATISATSAAGLAVDPLAVTLANGVANNQDFAISGMPGTVNLLDGFEFDWQYPEPAHPTQHTIFVLDETPRAANNGYADQYLWEILEWSCGWANGLTGHQNVLNAIWGHFDPVQAAPVHETGLTYWKDQINGTPTQQNLEDAIRSKDDPAPADGTASCIVFDRILINCLTVQGIRAVEVKVTADNKQFTRRLNNPAALVNAQYLNFLGFNGANRIFTDGLGRHAFVNGWEDTTIVGQGNIQSPRFWGSHWIAAVDTPAGWRFYDASYGAPLSVCLAPGVSPSDLSVINYEPHTALQFKGGARMPPAAFVGVQDIPLAPNADTLPHLRGEVLWP